MSMPNWLRRVRATSFLTSLARMPSGCRLTTSTVVGEEVGLPVPQKFLQFLLSDGTAAKLTPGARPSAALPQLSPNRDL